MKTKLLCTVLAFLLVLSFIRTVLGTGQLDLMQILVKLQEIDFNVDLANLVFEDAFDKITNIFRWNNDLTGVTGFFTNIANAISWFFSYLIDITEVFFNVLFYVVETLISLVVGVTRLAFALLF